MGDARWHASEGEVLEMGGHGLPAVNHGVAHGTVAVLEEL